MHVRGNAANLENRTIRLFYMRIDLNSQERKFLLFCPPDWLYSYDVQGVYLFVEYNLHYTVFHPRLTRLIVAGSKRNVVSIRDKERRKRFPINLSINCEVKE